MTTTTTMERPSVALAAEVRAIVARQGITQAELAQRLGHNTAWMSVRIGKRPSVDMTFDELVEMADALGVEAEGIVVSALRACRDSNPKPSDLYPVGSSCAGIVKPLLTVNRDTGIRSTRWGLAA